MYAKHMLSEAGRKVLTEIARKGTARAYSPRSKFLWVVFALCDLGYITPGFRPRRYTITDAGAEALKR